MPYSCVYQAEVNLLVGIRMKKILAVVLLAVLMEACKEAPKTEDVVGQTAKTYYEMLLRGDFELFVDGTYRPDSIPASYREQLVANAKMYSNEQQEAHKGIQRVEVIRARVDTAQHSGNVFLMLSYGDSTKEQIVVPMVCHDGVWYMK